MHCVITPPSHCACDYNSRPGTVNHTLSLSDDESVVLDNMLVDAVYGPYLFVRDPWAGSPILPVYADPLALVEKWWSVEITGKTATVGSTRIVIADSLSLYVDINGNPMIVWPKGLCEPMDWEWFEEIPLSSYCEEFEIPAPTEPVAPAMLDSISAEDAPEGSIAWAKLSGGLVSLTGKVVTAVFHETGGAVECFYIEEEDRSNAIKVVPDDDLEDWLPVQAGQKVDVAGEVMVEPNDAECYSIDAHMVKCTGPGLVNPLMMAQKSMAGGEFGSQRALYLDSPNAVGGSGLNPIALRVRATGKVTYVNGTVCCMDDGTGLKSTVGGSTRTGLKVEFPNACPYSSGNDVQDLTGILTAELSNNVPVPVLRVPAPANTNVIRVKWNSSSPGYGTTWATAYHTVQAAITAASAGCEIWVAGDTSNPPYEYQERITLNDGVALYGGFNGTETGREQRDWVDNETILDGDELGTVVSLSECTDSRTRLDGFTIQHGSSLSGGGVYSDFSSFVVANCTISDNTGGYCGGGILVDSAMFEDDHSVIWSNRISDNDSLLGWGGGIYFDGGIAVAAGNDVDENAALRGGGIYTSGSDVLILGNSVQGNAANLAGWGGGVYCDGYESLTRIIGNLIAGNAVGSTGEGGGLMLEYGDGARVERNSFMQNDGGSHGGGMAMHHSEDVVIVNNVFWRNHCNDQDIGGGAVQLYGNGDYGASSGTVVNNTFVENWVGEAETWSANMDDLNGHGGAVLMRYMASATLVNNIFFDNQALYGNSAACIWGGDATVSYCDAYPPGSQDPDENRDWHYYGDYESTITVEGSCVWGDPLFCSTSDFWLQTGSAASGTGENPGVNSPVPDSDKDGRPRPGDTTTDMGAYEDTTCP